MSKSTIKQENHIETWRFMSASIVILCVSIILTVRLWHLQIYNGDYYRRVSENNRIRKIEIPAERGVIYDRNGDVFLGNRPFYDLVFYPLYVKDLSTTFNILSRLLHIPVSQLERRLRIGRGLPRYLPITLKRNLTLHEVSIIESNRIFIPGVDIATAPRRDYPEGTPVHLTGYLGEVDAETLKRLSKSQTKHHYLPGDLIGKQGLESQWEEYLRGKNGYRLIQVDAFGRQINLTNTSERWGLPVVNAQKGSDLELTIDASLQNATAEAFRGKYGSVVALDPNNGEILSMISEPGYDPTMYQRSMSREEWYSLISNPFKPLFDKSTGGEYIPGSIYKSVIAIAALEEKVVNLSSTINCPGHFTLGNQLFHCWDRNGHGVVDLKKALVKSCDVFFYLVGVELGVDRIAKYAKEFGLGKKLGIQLNHERPGLVPTSDWKKKTFNKIWTPGDTPNIAIGQGYNLLTPLQMASLYGAIANGGKVWRPFLVKRISNYLGDTIFSQKPELVTEVKNVSPQTFATLRRILGLVVMSSDGTGRNAQVPGVTVAGKTGSAQVVSLKKNNKSDDVSVKWKEHAIFSAFSPINEAKIAIAIVSENDSYGGGGAQAAPIAQKILKSFWSKKKETPNTALKIKIDSQEETRQ